MAGWGVNNFLRQEIHTIACVKLKHVLSNGFN